jgi:hypothetical protein
MKKFLLFGLISLFTLVLNGCASTPEKKADGAFVDTMIVPVEYSEAWRVTRDVLLDQDVEIYTRDKRGLFVVYANPYRKKYIFPHRTKLTVTLTSESESSTRIAVETVHQKYSVSLLTHPSWSDQSAVSLDNAGIEVLESIKSIISRKL